MLREPGSYPYCLWHPLITAIKIMSSTFPAILAVHSGMIAAAINSLSKYVYVYLFVEKYEQCQINQLLAERIVIYVELVVLAVLL